MLKPVPAYLYAYYQDGRFIEYTVTNVAGLDANKSGAAQFILVKGFDIAHSHDPSQDHDAVMASLHIRARLLQAEFKIAQSEVLDRINRLLSTENGAS